MTSPLFDTYMSAFFHKSNTPPSAENTRYFDAVLGPVLPTDKSARILEIGVGMGHFAFYATKIKGYTAYSGFDLSPECAAYVKERIAPTVFHCADPLDFLRHHKETYDAVVMLDVLEHIPKEQQLPYLQAIHPLLAPNAPFIVRTENTASFTGYYQHTMDYTHAYNFSPASLEQVLTLAEYHDIRLFGDATPVTGVRSLLRAVALKTWHAAIRAVYRLERPGCVNPTILTKNLYAVSKK